MSIYLCCTATSVFGRYFKHGDNESQNNNHEISREVPMTPLKKYSEVFLFAGVLFCALQSA